jgi:acetylornithine deacetylase/succinyl-diaminopimelate desuccinylase-like protein
MDFIRFASVSAQPAHADDVRRCAAWLAEHLRRIGLDHVVILPTPGHPVVYADWLRAPGKPVLMVYGHYDVQPADPLPEWRSPPFDPQIRGDDLFGRGASDDKGQMFAHVKAIEWCLRRHGRLPLNVRCLFEGEEEIGSPNLAGFLSARRDELAADAAVVSDTKILAVDRPAITESLRGSVSFDLQVRGQKHDVHSGNFGGVIHNPLRALCAMLASLHDVQGRVAILGFYDSVRTRTMEERIEMAKSGPGDAEVLHHAGASGAWGEPGYSLYERTGIRTAVEITGLQGGYQGPGMKSVIPARASAKVNMRLAPDQTPEEIDRRFRQHIAQACPDGLRCSVVTYGPASPATADRGHPAVRAAARAYRAVFGTAPVFLRSGGTIPVVSLLGSLLRVQTVLMGFALPDDRSHAPNEKFHLPTYARAIQTSICFLAELGGTR